MRNILDNVFVVVDFETVTPTGRPAEPMELAGAWLGKQLTPLSVPTFSSLMSLPADVALTPFDTAQTGITLKDLSRAPDPAAVFSAFESLIEGTELLVAHNASYEMRILQRFLAKNAKAIKCAMIDTVALSRFLLPKLDNHKLDTLAKQFKIPVPANRHRAAADVELTRAVLIRLLESALTAGISDRENLERIARINWPKAEQTSLF